MANDPKSVAQAYFVDVWSRGMIEAVDRIMAPDIVGHEGSDPPIKGIDAAKALISSRREAFPDVDIKITHQIVEGDMVATRWVATGTHKGQFGRIPATGKTVSTTGIHIQRIRDGKIIEGWANWDGVGLLQQIGVLPVAK